MYISRHNKITSQVKSFCKWYSLSSRCVLNASSSIECLKISGDACQYH